MGNCNVRELTSTKTEGEQRNMKIDHKYRCCGEGEQRSMKKMYKTHIATFKHQNDAKVAAARMITLPLGWKCVSENTKIYMYGPKANYSSRTDCRVQAFIKGYLAAKY